jgi:hypothetical protein
LDIVKIEGNNLSSISQKDDVMHLKIVLEMLVSTFQIQNYRNLEYDYFREISVSIIVGAASTAPCVTSCRFNPLLQFYVV